MEEKFLTVEKAIETILLNNPFTRADDMLLYLEYLRSIGARETLQPYIVYYKAEDEKRGNNLIACCEECAKELYESLR